MSPEQARGEGHRVDGRSATSSAWAWCSTNCWWDGSLFVRNRLRSCWSRSRVSSHARPASATTTIPKELERICLKALSKRASERYSTAKDMADDLRLFLAEQTINQQPARAMGLVAPSITPVLQPPSTAPASDGIGHGHDADLGPPAHQDRAEGVAVF